MNDEKLYARISQLERDVAALKINGYDKNFMTEKLNKQHEQMNQLILKVLQIEADINLIASSWRRQSELTRNAIVLLWIGIIGMWSYLTYFH